MRIRYIQLLCDSTGAYHIGDTEDADATRADRLIRDGVAVREIEEATAPAPKDREVADTAADVVESATADLPIEIATATRKSRTKS